MTNTVINSPLSPLKGSVSKAENKRKYHKRLIIIIQTIFVLKPPSLPLCVSLSIK